MGYGASAGNTTYSGTSDKTISTSQFVRSTQTQAFTYTLTSGTSLVTLYPKAHYTSGTATLTAGSAIYIAPAYSYSTTGDQTINVSTTQAFTVSSIVGNGSSVAITSSPNIGSGTNSATMTPGTANDIYTISFAGTANYLQTSNTTDTLTVNPTVSISSNASSGYPTVDENSGAINSTTHGVSITTFTITPSVVGSNVDTYDWGMASGWSFNGGYGDSTAGPIAGKFTTSGTKNNTLLVSGEGTSATSATETITVTAVTKNWDSATSTETNLRRGDTFTVSAQVDYIMRPKLQRYVGGLAWVDISNTPSISGGGTNQSVTINFTINSDMTIEGTDRSVRVIDSDNTSKTDTIDNYDAQDGVPIAPTSVTPTSGNGSNSIAWSGESYDGGGNLTTAYSNSGGTTSVGTVSDASTPSTYSESATTGAYAGGITLTRYYRVSSINVSSPAETANSNVSSAGTIYPVLTTSKNTINPTTQTIFSTTRNTDTSTYPTTFTFSSPGTRTDNITTRTYSEGSSYFNLTGDTTPSSQTGTQPGVVALTSVTSGENVTYTVVGNTGSQTTLTTCAVTVNYSKELYSLSSVSVGGDNDTVNDSLSFSFSWQGFSLGSTRYQLYETNESTQRGSNIDTNWGGTAGSERTAQASGTVSLTSQVTSPANGFGYSTAGTYKIKISIYDGTSQSTLVGTAFTAAFTTNAVADITSLLKGLAEDSQFVGWETKLLAAEQVGSEVTYNTAIGSGALYAFNVNVDSKISTTNTLSGTYDFAQAEVFYNYNDGTVLELGSDGVVDTSTDGTPVQLAAVSEVSDSATDVTIRITGNTIVTRTIHVVSDQAINGSTTMPITLSEGTGTTQQNASYSADHSLTTVFGGALASSTTYAITVRGVNAAESGSLSNSANVTTDAPATSWSTTFANITLSEEKATTATSNVDTAVITNGDGSTIFACATPETNSNIIQIALSTSGDPGTSGTDSSGTGWQSIYGGTGGTTYTKSHSGAHTTTYYIRYRCEINAGSDGTIESVTATMTNNSVADTVSITLHQQASGGGGGV
jgi:hypothetical protein